MYRGKSRQDDRRDHRRYDNHRPYRRSRSRSRRSPSSSYDDMNRRSGSYSRENDKREATNFPNSNDVFNNKYGALVAPPPPTIDDTSCIYAGIYDDFPSVPPAPQPPEWNIMPTPPSMPAHQPPPMQIPPPMQMSTQQIIQTINYEDKMKKEAAIESEMRHQKAALSKQREDYVKKSVNLKKELESLKDQRDELRGDTKRSPSPDTKRFLKENTKLQLEIQNKLKTIDNVVEMLNGIIGGDVRDISPSASSARDPTEKPHSRKKSRSPTRFNYVYYDPEMHWCRLCNEFPSTAKDYLNHLHSSGHHKNALQHKEAPWHSLPASNEGFPTNPAAPNKRTPIRGLQFFVPSTAWYCKLCDQFIGDLHCASAHLKSVVHSKNYSNFVEQNPHWETDWMSDRQKAIEKKTEKTFASQNSYNKEEYSHKRKKSKSLTPKLEDKKKRDKKKNRRKRMSSSSSDSSSSATPDRDRDRKKPAIKSTEKPRPMKSSNEEKLTLSDKKLLEKLKESIKMDILMKSDDEGKKEDKHRQETRTKISKTTHNEDKKVEKVHSRDRKPIKKEQEKCENNREKKVDVKKMPFIGKMPVFKILKKNEEAKKEDQKAKEEEEAKKKQENEAEMKKKVDMFRDKISKTQFEDVPRVDIGPPGLVLSSADPIELQLLNPNQLIVPPHSQGSPNPMPQISPMQSMAQMRPMNPMDPNMKMSRGGSNDQMTSMALQKDIQDAIDIIFPNSKPNLAPRAFAPNIPVQMRPNITQYVHPSTMRNFDIGKPRPMFTPRQRFNKPKSKYVPPNQRPKKKQVNSNQKAGFDNKNSNRKAEELALLGIDAGDVGAGV